MSLQRPNDFVVRCSIVGPEQDTNRSLMAWFLSRKVPVKGFTNQSWNGITTLEWAKVSYAIMRGKTQIDGRIIQPASLPPVSKCQLLGMIAEIWHHEVLIQPAEAPRPITRVLWPNLSCPPLLEQLHDLHNWYR